MKLFNKPEQKSSTVRPMKAKPMERMSTRTMVFLALAILAFLFSGYQVYNIMYPATEDPTLAERQRRLVLQEERRKERDLKEAAGIKEEKKPSVTVSETDIQALPEEDVDLPPLPNLLLEELYSEEEVEHYKASICGLVIEAQMKVVEEDQKKMGYLMDICRKMKLFPEDADQIRIDQIDDLLDYFKYNIEEDPEMQVNDTDYRIPRYLQKIRDRLEEIEREKEAEKEAQATQ